MNWLKNILKWKKMNSYFEQSGFYGHPHQAAAGMMSAASSGHDQTAAYRGFPLSLGMSPYANHHLHQTRTAQDSPYDASITAACKQIYDGAYNKDCSKSVSGATANGTTANSGAASAATNAAADTNGYKDVWNSTGSNPSQNSGAPVRPSACTPDSRVGGYIDASGGSPVSRTGSAAAGAWNTNCSIGGTTGTQSSASATLHQNHTFYPWMAIAGELPIYIFSALLLLLFPSRPCRGREREKRIIFHAKPFERYFFLWMSESLCGTTARKVWTVHPSKWEMEGANNFLPYYHHPSCNNFPHSCSKKIFFASERLNYYFFAGNFSCKF